MSSNIQDFINETNRLPASQKVEMYRQWLRDNPNNPETLHIQSYLNFAIQLKTKDEEAEELKTQAEELKTQAEELKTENKQLKTKDKQLKTENKQLKFKIKTQDKQIKAQAEVIIERSLSSVRDKFPAKTDRTESGSHLSDNHSHADVHELNTDRCLRSIEKKWLSERFWNTGFLHSDSSQCHSESSIQFLVMQLLLSILHGLGLHKYVNVVQHRTQAGVECDILLVYKPNLLPFAVVEVKKPCNTNENRLNLWRGVKKKCEGVKRGRSNVVAGQIYDAMNAIKLYGYHQVCGMIATGNHWRIVGTIAKKKEDKNILEKLEQTTSSNTFQEILNGFIGLDSQNHTRKRSRQSDFVHSPAQPTVNFKATENEKTVDDGSRAVWASKIVPSFDSIISQNGTEDDIFNQVENSGTPIVSLVVLFVAQACKSLLNLLQANNSLTTSLQAITIRSKMPCRVLTDNEKVFAFSTTALKSLRLDKFCPASIKRLQVIHHLGMGEYGNCCLAVSGEGGHCCAVKFFHRSDPDILQDAAQNECSNWNKVYATLKKFPKCRVIKAAEGHCLVMPYLQPIPQEDRLKLINDGSIKKTLQMFCGSGFLHPDIKWRHLGIWNGQIVLLDLGRLEEVRDEKAKQDWCKDALEKLTQTATEDDDKTPKKKRTKR